MFRFRLPQFLFHLAHIWIGIKGHFKLLSVDFALLVQNVSIDLRHHLRLGMTGVSLGRLDVTVVELQLIGCAAMTQ